MDEGRDDDDAYCWLVGGDGSAVVELVVKSVDVETWRCRNGVENVMDEV